MKQLGLTVAVAAAIACGACLTVTFAQDTPATWRPEKGDRIALIGNALPERMQHHGWLETYLQAALPDHELVVRNLGFSGDRINKRPRNRGFPTPDEYLNLAQADVIFAFFGYNESFDGKPDQFRQQVVEWVEQTKKKSYNGSGAPDIVLFSPIGHENLRTHNLPDGRANNGNLSAYAHALQQAAAETGVAYVDLFTPSMKLYETADEPLTINGIHLTERGNREIAKAIVQAVGAAPSTDDARLEKIRAAVLDKNWHWFNRYRATDGNDVWGSRSTLKFTDGQTNAVVLQRELEQLDAMTANRDKAVWALAQGKDGYKVDDSGVPAAVPVKSNFTKPQQQGGKSKTGTLDFLSPQETNDTLKLAEGMKSNVFASEEMFPEFVNPVQLGVDTKGRVWAAVWKTYPKWEPTKQMEDRLVILPDEDRDGVADKCITFAKVHNPTGFEFWGGGVVVVSAPDILFLKDTDGDDVADVRIRLFHGIDSADTHHAANNLVYGPDGYIYYQRGVFHVSNVETPWQTNQESGRSGMYRFNPRTFQFSFHANIGPNPHGISFDRWGYHYATDGTGGQAFQVIPAGNGNFKMRNLLKKTVRPVPSSGILSSAHFPERNNGNYLICNAIAFLGIKQYTLNYDTAKGEVNGEEIEDLLSSTDGNFRPTDFEVGNDGALYVSDWCNPIVGHMQHNIRDPARDHDHGRIFRITVEGRPLSEPVTVDGEPIPKLLELLRHPINGVRQRVRVELSGRPTKDVLAAVDAWVKGLNPQAKDDAHALTEALWLYQQHNVVNRELLNLLLNSPEPHARIAAQRVQYMWDHHLGASDAAQPAESEAEGATITKLPEADVVIHTIVEKMRYDKTEFTVKAGKPVKLLVVNPDFLPHNLVIGKPGSADPVALAAIAMGAEGFAAGFIPKDDRILFHTKLLNHSEFELLEFNAPAEPGDYDFVCTFPGHHQTMRGVMKVVE